MCTGIFSKHGGSGGRRTQVLKPNPTHHPLWRSWSHRALDWGTGACVDFIRSVTWCLGRARDSVVTKEW